MYRYPIRMVALALTRALPACGGGDKTADATGEAPTRSRLRRWSPTGTW